MSLPDTCPSCGTDLSPATVTQTGGEGNVALVCGECGEEVSSGSTRVNFKSPVVDESTEETTDG